MVKPAAKVHQGADLQTGVKLVGRGQFERHLGIRLSKDPSAATDETCAGILGFRKVANHWVSRQLTQIRRLHLAKQISASKLTYYATLRHMQAMYMA